MAQILEEGRKWGLWDVRIWTLDVSLQIWNRIQAEMAEKITDQFPTKHGPTENTVLLCLVTQDFSNLAANRKICPISRATTAECDTQHVLRWSGGIFFVGPSQSSLSWHGRTFKAQGQAQLLRQIGRK
jgi:hypothetical protein